MRLLFVYKCMQLLIVGVILVLLFIPVNICFLNGTKLTNKIEGNDSVSVTHSNIISNWVCVTTHLNQRYCQEKNSDPYSASFCLADNNLLIPTAISIISIIVICFHLIYMAAEGKLVKKQNPGCDYCINLCLSLLWLAAVCMLVFVHVHWNTEWKSEWISWRGDSVSNAHLNQHPPSFPSLWKISHGLGWLNLLLHILEALMPFAWHQGHIKLQNRQGSYTVHQQFRAYRHGIMPPE